MKYRHFRNKLSGIIHENLGISYDTMLGYDDRLVGDLGADTLDIIKIIGDIEDDFDINIPDYITETDLPFGTISNLIYDIVSLQYKEQNTS